MSEQWVNTPQARTNKEYLQMEIRRLQAQLAAIEAEEKSEGETTWTTEFPTKPGFYWVRNLSFRIGAEGYSKPDPAHQIVQFAAPSFPPDARPFISLLGWDVGQPLERIYSAEWYGPIEPPE